MLVFLLALLLCEVLAEPLGERPAHPVPEELFLRSFLTFPGGPLLGHCCGSCWVQVHTAIYTLILPCQRALRALTSVFTGPSHLRCALAELPCRPLHKTFAVVGATLAVPIRRCRHRQQAGAPRVRALPAAAARHLLQPRRPRLLHLRRCR